jgi:hypothetical protein
MILLYLSHRNPEAFKKGINDLPRELLHLTFSNLSIPDLKSSSLVSRSWFNLSRPLIFRHVTLAEAMWSEKSLFQIFKEFYNVFSSQDRFPAQEFIRELDLDPSLFVTYQDYTWPRFKSIFGGLVGLQSLSIEQAAHPNAMSWHYSEKIFDCFRNSNLISIKMGLLFPLESTLDGSEKGEKLLERVLSALSNWRRLKSLEMLIPAEPDEDWYPEGFLTDSLDEGSSSKGLKVSDFPFD